MSDRHDLAEMIRSRDRDALAGFFDGRAGYVIAYCGRLCAPGLADEAALAAFVDFLARVQAAAVDSDLDLLLVKATRGCAAARLDLHDAPAICRAAPELLAASANGELRHDDEALAEHLEHCERCQATAQRLLDGERALKERPAVPATDELREEWLRIALGALSRA
jgi:hypothetical protein